MPKQRVRRTDKAKWSAEALNAAKQLHEQGVSMRNAAKRCGIPFSTLQERLQKDNFATPTLGRKPIFTEEQEKEMAKQIKYLASIFYGCTDKEVRRMAFDFAERNGIKHSFNTDLKMAGRDWLTTFRRRNKIAIRKAEATSLNRATAFNKEEVNTFFVLLQQVMEKHNFSPRNIYNVDETGISTVQEPGKVLAAKGQRRVGSMTSWERGRNITAVCAMSAAGGYIPPMFIYPRQRHSPLLEKDGPVGAYYKCSKNGWITEQLFIEWLKHFSIHAKPSENEKVLLILDNHTSHDSLAAYEFCRKNNIIMLSIPPHTSHRIQPLDVSFYGPLKAYYRNECNLYMKNHAGEQITPYEVASLFRKAFVNAASVGKAESGFKATGIYPFDPSVFKEDDFLAAEALNQPEEVLVLENHEIEVAPNEDTRFPLVNKDKSSGTTAIPTTSKQASSAESEVTPIPSTSKTSLDCSVEDLLPNPRKNTKVTKPKGRPKQHATILTSTSLKDVLEAKEEKKKVKLQKSRPRPNKIKGNNEARRKILDSPESENAKKEETKSTTQRVSKKKFKPIRKRLNSTSPESDIDMKDICIDSKTDSNLYLCILCKDYGANNELWYRCIICGKWAHSQCSGRDSPTGYIYDYCENGP